MTTAVVERAAPAVPRTAPPTPRGWLFKPWIDLLLLANVLWPLAVVITLVAGQPPFALRFWQVYFVTIPHRWITLALVFLDRDRYRTRPQTFVALAGLAVVVCLGAYLLFGQAGLMVLLAVDFLWNAWHFASQHAGILRIYGRMARPNMTGAGLEKIAVRAFVLYVLFRVASVTITAADFGGNLTWLLDWSPLFHAADGFALLVPLALLGRELRAFGPGGVGRLAYLVSMTGIYSLLLAAVHYYDPATGDLAPAILGLALGVTLFHALEYLAVASWAALRTKDADGPLGRLVPYWGAAMIVYLAALGFTAFVMHTWLAVPWLLLNLVVSYLHYAYDGLIWKARRPAPKPA